MWQLQSERAVDRVTVYGGAGAVVGAWLAAAAVPLDWGVWWQRWPVSSLLGLAAGHAVGVMWALTTLTRGKLPEQQV